MKHIYQVSELMDAITFKQGFEISQHGLVHRLLFTQFFIFL